MFKIALLKGKELAREKAINPMIGDKFNTEELWEFYHRVSRDINYDNSNRIEYFCRYINN